MPEASLKRKLTAILSADVKGYSRLMGDDEITTIHTLEQYREVMRRFIEEHRGRVVDSPGDNLLAEFASVVDAVESAIEIQKELKARNDELPGNRKMEFRIGINLGDVVEDRERIVWNFYWRAPKIEPASKEKMAFPLPDKPSIAVLPFVNISKDPEQGYLADGLTENIITALSQIHEMFVIARDSTFTYKGTPVKVQKVAEDLGVRYILEGSVQKEGDRVRINAQLIDTDKGHHLWAQRFDRDFKDLFALQDEITLKIAIAVSVELTEGEEALVRHRSTHSLEAWGLGVQSISVGSASKESSTKARALLERAVEIDPNYAWAWSRLALTYYWDARFGFSSSREESWKRGVELAKKAIALDEQLPEGHVTLALLYLFREQYDEAVAEGEKAVALGPNDSTTLTRIAQVMHYSGKFEEALSMLKRAKRLNPHYEEVLLRFLGGAYRFTGQTEKAIEAAKELRDRFLKKEIGKGSASIPLLHLTSIYGEIGLLEEAQRCLKEAQDLNPDISMEWARKYAIFRNPAHSQRILDGLRKAGLK